MTTPTAPQGGELPVDLLSCAFCGMSAGISETWQSFFQAQCQDCAGCSEICETESDAIAAWNTRADNPEIARLSAKLAEVREWANVASGSWCTDRRDAAVSVPALLDGRSSRPARHG